MKLEDVILKGTRVQQPNFATVAIGTLYFVTDESKLERSSGAAWEIYQGASGGAITQLTGDVTAGPGSGSQVATISADAVTFAKIQNINTDKLVGRDTAASGNPEEIGVTAPIAFDGAGNIIISDNGISDGKLRDSAAVSVIGRASNSLGDPADIVAGADDRLLTRIASALAFTQLSVGMIPDALITYAKIQNISATSRVLGRKTAGAGVTEEITLSELLDFIGSAAHGDVLFRGATVWQRLAAGTSGQFLKTNGAGANPAWADAGGGGGLVVSSIVTLTDAQIKGLATTPVQIIPAPGVGKIRTPVAASIQIDKAAGAYNVGTTWRLRYAGVTISLIVFSSLPLNTTTDFYISGPDTGFSLTGTNAQAANNAAINIAADSDVTGGNVANSARIEVLYFESDYIH